MDAILEQIGHTAARYPEKTAYRFREERLSYAALWRGAGSLAALLLERGVLGPVAVFGHKGALMPLCFLACARAGKAYLPLDPACPPARIAKILRDAGARTVLAAEPFSLEGCDVWDARALWACARAGTPCPGIGRGPDVPFYLLYTSGSTGGPKGVRIKAENLFHFTMWAKGFAPERERAVWLNYAPYSFDLSVMALYPALASGAALCDLPGTEDFPALFAALRESAATVWVSTPSLAALCLADPGFGRALLPRLHTFLFCGETLPSRVALGLMERFPGARVVNAYGPTETTVAVTSVEITREMCGRALPVGRAKPGSEIWVVDDALRRLPDGARGQIAIIGDTVGAGYLGCGARDNGRFVLLGGRRAYLTGDLGSLEGGMLYFHRRMDDQLKLRGCRIEPAEVEAALLELDGVRQAAVVAWERNGALELAAFAVCDGRTTGELRRALRELLPAYMLPRRLALLDSLPLGVNGKCDRKKLMEMI